MLSSVLGYLVRCESTYLRLSAQRTVNRNTTEVIQIQRAKREINSQISMRMDSVARGLGLSQDELRRKHLPRSLDGLWFVSQDELGIKTPSDFLRREIAKLMSS